MIFFYFKKIFILNILLVMDVEAAIALDRSKQDVADKVLSDPVGISNFFQMFLGLFLIIILIIGLAWFVKRINGIQGNMGGVLKVLSMISVGQREKLVLVQVGEIQLLIGVASGNVNTLLVLDEPVKNTSTGNSGVSFADRLSAVIKGKAVKL